MCLDPTEPVPTTSTDGASDISGCTPHLAQQTFIRVQQIRGWLRARLVCALWLAPPCSSFSQVAGFGPGLPRPRSNDFPHGLPDLTPALAAKVSAANAITEHDKIVAGGRGDKLHRVAHRVLEPGPCRTQLEAYDVSGLPLSAYAAVYSTIKAYALIPLVGRRVEAAHAELKRLGKPVPK